MTAVTFTLNQVPLNGQTLIVSLNGGSFALDISDGFNLSGSTMPVSSLNITSGTINLGTASSGTVLTGSIVVDMASTTPGTAPVVTVNNFAQGSGYLQVSWPTTTGNSEQNVQSGNPLPLTGYKG